MEGFIKIHRKILEWEWYKDVPTCHLFFHLLLKANWEDKKWKGKDIPRGTLIVGVNSLSETSGLTVSQIRTALNKLKMTNEIAIKTTSSYSFIQIQNWQLYQHVIANEIANEGQTDSKRMTTTKEGNKGIREEEYTNTGAVSVETTPKEETILFFESLPNEMESIIASINSDPQHHDTIKIELQKFYNYWTERTPNGKKQLWQTKPTFEVKRRLATWFSKSQFNSYNQKPKGVVQA